MADFVPNPAVPATDVEDPTKLPEVPTLGDVKAAPGTVIIVRDDGSVAHQVQDPDGSVIHEAELQGPTRNTDVVTDADSTKSAKATANTTGADSTEAPASTSTDGKKRR